MYQYLKTLLRKYSFFLSVVKSVRLYLAKTLCYTPCVPFHLKFYLEPSLISSLNISLYDKFHISSFDASSQRYLDLFPAFVNPSSKSISLACWLAARSFSNCHVVSSIISSIIGRIDFSDNFFRERSSYLYPFLMHGDYITLDRILLETRSAYNLKCSRSAGFYGEVDHFHAIGHTCLFYYLLQAIAVRHISIVNVTLRFYYSSVCLPNKLFFTLVSQYSKSFPVELIKIDSNKTDLITNPIYDRELEIWPGLISSPEEPIVARHHFSALAASCSASIPTPHLHFPEYLLDEVELFLSQYRTSEFFVGLHLRSADDGRALRNASHDSVLHLLSTLRSRGIQVFLICSSSSLSYKYRDYITDLREISISSDHFELLQLYVWRFSRFFIGSQSGGTLPPSTFGTPILWLDYHPSVHVYWPNTVDIYLPRLVFCVKEHRYLTYSECLLPEHRFCQSESAFIARRFGYKVESCLPSSIDHAIDLLSSASYRNSKHTEYKVII